jgi:ribonuclease HII
MPDLSLETAALGAGWTRIAGIDEAGRGPLAGPVVAAAVVLDASVLSSPVWAALDDSKKMTGTARETLYQVISDTADIGVGIATVDDIDLLNILGATMKAMGDAVRALKPAPDYALIDGNRLPMLTCAGACVVKGDSKSMSIAAASVIAKVTRDRIMKDLDQCYPGYGWAQNAGYGTKQHMDALTRLGATPAHRKSFAPVRKILSEGQP